VGKCMWVVTWVARPSVAGSPFFFKSSRLGFLTDSVGGRVGTKRPPSHFCGVGNHGPFPPFFFGFFVCGTDEGV
jgi:hypothetical protein